MMYNYDLWVVAIDLFLVNLHKAIIPKVFRTLSCIFIYICVYANTMLDKYCTNVYICCNFMYTNISWSNTINWLLIYDQHISRLCLDLNICLKHSSFTVI